ncbi:MAG: hypothetical protein O3A46_12370 [Candidatus Poribacteria bacterium]|nr:hypothetical protein [Candidatus Poribacteria bacterium]
MDELAEKERVATARQVRMNTKNNLDARPSQSPGQRRTNATMFGGNPLTRSDIARVSSRIRKSVLDSPVQSVETASSGLTRNATRSLLT